MVEAKHKLPLPQSRYYLRAAKYGIKKLLEVRPMDEGFLFYIAGIFASLRAVQHALINHDRNLSPEHKRAIDAWKRNTPMSSREIDFIKWGRDEILKGGAFKGYAAKDETNEKRYDTAYYRKRGDKLKRRDLIKDFRAAARWCDRQLSTIEAQVRKVS